MKNLIWKLVRIAFHFICIMIAVYLARSSILQYNEDRNSLDVRYQSFQSRNSSTYPTISMCFSSPFKNNKLQNYRKDLSPLQYSNFLMGKTNYDNSFANVSFEDVTLMLDDFLLSASLATKNIGTDEKEASVIPWVTTLNFNVYEWRFLKCFSFNIPYDEGVLINRLLIKLNRKVFPNSKRPMDGWTKHLGISMFYHLPNQLFKSFATRKIMWPPEILKTYVTIVYASNIEVKIRRRKKRNVCTTIENYDEWVTERITSSVGCFPPYWKSLTGIPACNTSTQLKKISEEVWNTFYGKASVPEPCTSMTHINLEYLDSEPWDEGSKDIILFPVYFRENSYREIRQIRAYTSRDLIGDIGGCNGFLLGYALAQVPNYIRTAFLILLSVKQFTLKFFSSKRFLVNCVEDIKEDGGNQPESCEIKCKEYSTTMEYNQKSSNTTRVIQVLDSNNLKEIMHRLSLVENVVAKLGDEIKIQSDEVKHIKEMQEKYGPVHE